MVTGVDGKGSDFLSRTTDVRTVVGMSRLVRWSWHIDVALVIISVIVLLASVWVWLAALPIPRETIFLATTIALIISVILVINVAVLVVLRLQRRVAHLEEMMKRDQEVGPIPKTKTAVVVTLSNTERRIINQLEAAGGTMTQNELRRLTGLSKSTLSVNLSGLERKSLISRETEGRTKTVHLIRKVER
ncbi:MAG: helix-turn-helix transcriptional regulator [Candidatus Thorarchaeota archaeon SMTZ1-83]|nr:MAG: hypothetical protein AM324_12345 [Candidatus Thorarchaeota archaeon SMTZ1-83]